MHAFLDDGRKFVNNWNNAYVEVAYLDPQWLLNSFVNGNN